LTKGKEGDFRNLGALCLSAAHLLLRGQVLAQAGAFAGDMLFPIFSGFRISNTFG
jgi:hypothetical protein